MRLRTFLWFVAPSIAVMAILILVPLVGSIWLSLHEDHVKTQLVEVRTETPLFGGIVRTDVKKVPQAVLGPDGQPVQVSDFVGGANFRSVVRPDRLQTAAEAYRAPGGSLDGLYRNVTNVAFFGALEFTLLYTLVTTPLVLLVGFLIALAVNGAARALKGPLIFASLLPFIVTPLVGALSIYWLFLDNAVVTTLMQEIGAGRVYFLKDAISIRALIIFYGVWNAAPFAFVVLYAGLQTVPQDALEAAVVDGASAWRRVRYVIVPHLMPLFVFIALIHLMDSYRVFEPVLVFGSSVYANSMQYLTYEILNGENNVNKAAAAGLLTILGVAVLLAPVLRRTWREQKGLT